MIKLQEIAAILLAEEIDFAELSKATEGFRTLLLEMSKLNLKDDSLRNDVHTSEGMAIGTEWAARCVDDMVRTKRFVKGVAEAIEHQLNLGHKPVELLYAGTGPFATLVLPLLTVYSPEELQLTLVEINDVSFKAVQGLFKSNDFSPYLRALYQADATTLQLDEPKRFDILLSETMQYALQKEPQVAITLNLLPQLREDALLIPEEISLDLVAIRQVGLGVTEPTALAKLLVISRETLTFSPLWESTATSFPPVDYQLVDDDLAHAQELGISTTIKVFGTQHIGFNESGLTIPKRILNVEELPAGKKTISCQYHLGAKPGLVSTIT